jgi:hypothetical protein
LGAVAGSQSGDATAPLAAFMQQWLDWLYDQERQIAIYDQHLHALRYHYHTIVQQYQERFGPYQARIYCIGYTSVPTLAAAPAQPAAPPQQSVAAAAQPQQSVAASAQPQQSVAAAAQWQQFVAAAAQPQQFVAAGAQWQQVVAAATQSQQVVAAATQPQQFVAAAAQPHQFVAAAAQPQQFVAAAAQPQRFVAAAAHPQQFVAAAAHPQQFVAAAAQPQQFVAATSGSSATGGASVAAAGGAAFDATPAAVVQSYASQPTPAPSPGPAGPHDAAAPGADLATLRAVAGPGQSVDGSPATLCLPAPAAALAIPPDGARSVMPAPPPPTTLPSATLSSSVPPAPEDLPGTPRPTPMPTALPPTSSAAASTTAPAGAAEEKTVGWVKHSASTSGKTRFAFPNDDRVDAVFEFDNNKIMKVVTSTAIDVPPYKGSIRATFHIASQGFEDGTVACVASCTSFHFFPF